MNSSMPRKGRLAYQRDDEEALDRPRLCALVVLKGLRQDPAVDSNLSATADVPAHAAAVSAKVESPASTRAGRRPSHGIDALQPAGDKTFAGDPAFVVPVIASPQEIRYAHELREQLKKKYLDQPSRPCSPWCVGVD
jgi:hypothetical protein